MPQLLGPPGFFHVPRRQGLWRWSAFLPWFFFGALSFAQIEGSAGDTATKPFFATVAIREGYDSNPLTESYQSGQGIAGSTYTSIQPSLGYNYTGLQADLALRYDFSGTYFPALSLNYDIQYAQTLVGRWTYAIDPRLSITLADNFLYTEQPIVDLVTVGITPLFNTSTINNLATAEAAYRLTDRLSMVTRWNNTLVYVGGSGSAVSNYMNNGAFQQFRLDFTPETVGTFSFDYQLYDYDSDQFTYKDNQQASFSFGADHTFLPELFFSGRAGFQLNDNFGLANNPTFVGSGGIGSGKQELQADPFASLSATWNYEERSFVSAGFSVAVQQTDLATSSDTEAYTLNFNWDHRFTDKFYVIQSFFMNLAIFTPQLSASEFAAAGLAGAYQGSGQQTTFSYQFKFAYDFQPYLAAELGWIYTNFGSYFEVNNSNGQSYNRNQVYLGVRGTY
jgi:hypothetical protein